MTTANGSGTGSTSHEHGTVSTQRVPYADGVAAEEAAWWRYVGSVTGHATQKDIAAATGIDQSSISRWQRGAHTPRAEAAVSLARAYGRSPVEALVAAGYLSEGDLGVMESTTLTGHLAGASIDALLTELRRRLLATAPHQSQSWPAGWTVEEPGVRRPQNVEQSGDLHG